MGPSRIAKTMAVAAASVLLVAACSSSSKKATAGTSASTASSGASSGGSATGAPIKVGIICTCAGPFGTDIAPAEDVYKAWVNTVNSSGGLNGHPIQLTTENDNSNPGTSASDAQTLISDHVDAIVDLSTFDSTWASAVQAADIPVVGANEVEAPFGSNPDFYPQGQTTDANSAAVAAAAKAAGSSNLGDLYCAEAAICQQGVAPLKSAAQAAGTPLIYTAEISATAPNYTAQCVAAEQAHVGALFIGDAFQIIERVGQDCTQQGYNPAYIEEGEGFGSALLTAPGVSKNLWAEFNNLPYFANTPAVQSMTTAVNKYYPGLMQNTNVWTEIAAIAWPAGILLQDAVKAGGLSASDTPSAAEIVKGLNSLKGDTLQGWAPPLTFTAGQPHPVDCWFEARVQNGKASLPNGDKVTCENGSSGS